VCSKKVMECQFENLSSLSLSTKKNVVMRDRGRYAHSLTKATVTRIEDPHENQLRLMWLPLLFILILILSNRYSEIRGKSFCD